MSSRSEDDLKVPSQRSDEALRADEDSDHANDVRDIGRADDDHSGRADDDGYGGVREGDAVVRDPDDRLVAGDRTADDKHARDALPGDALTPDTTDDDLTRDRTATDPTARDRTTGDNLTSDRTADDGLTGDRTTDDDLARDRTSDDDLTGDRTADDDLARDRTSDDDLVERDPVAYTPATHGHTPVVPTDTGDDDNDESPYKDPYATTGGPDPAHTGVLADDVPAAVPAGEVPSHAAPQEVALFDQDPAEVQGRWRDLQASFVDDPGEAVQRADGLVGEVVESLTNSLTSRTNTLRERWKDVDSPDTEDLRQALRDYRNVLERLLALSTQETRR